MKLNQIIKGLHIPVGKLFNKTTFHVHTQESMHDIPAKLRKLHQSYYSSFEPLCTWGRKEWVQDFISKNYNNHRIVITSKIYKAMKTWANFEKE